MKADLFQSCGHCWVFQICWNIECSTFTASSFRIWNSSTGISLPPLALFILMLSKAHLTSHSRMSGSRWVITPLWLSGLGKQNYSSCPIYIFPFPLPHFPHHHLCFHDIYIHTAAAAKSLQSCPTLCDPTDDIHTTQHLSQQFICKEIHIKVHASLSGAHFHLFLAWPILIDSSKFILCFTFYEKYFLFNAEWVRCSSTFQQQTWFQCLLSS